MTEETKLIERLSDLSNAYLVLDRKLNIAIQALIEFESIDSASLVRCKSRETLRKIMEVK